MSHIVGMPDRCKHNGQFTPAAWSPEITLKAKRARIFVCMQCGNSVSVKSKPATMYAPRQRKPVDAGMRMYGPNRRRGNKPWPMERRPLADAKCLRCTHTTDMFGEGP